MYFELNNNVKRIKKTFKEIKEGEFFIYNNKLFLKIEELFEDETTYLLNAVEVNKGIAIYFDDITTVEIIK